MSFIKHNIVFFLFMAFGHFQVMAQFYNGSQQDFGKNRVQYQEFLWQYYSYKEYDVYFYKGGQDLAEYTARVSNNYIKELESWLDFYIEDKIEFIVYNTQSDFKQSNIGLSNDDTYNIGGVTHIVGSKVFLYYEGSHEQINQQIKAGITEIIINQMMYGGNWREVIKNSTLLTLPDWFKEGFISFASNRWDINIDSRVRDGVLSGRYQKFNRLEGMDAVYAGHSIWNYISEVYGDKVIKQIFYMSRASRNVESGFLYVLGVSLKTLSKQYIQYYQNKYATDEKFRNVPSINELNIKTKKSRVYYQFKISSDGTHAVWVTNEMGQYKVWLYDFNTGKTKKIAKGNHKLDRITDYSFPVVGWMPGGKALTFFTEEKGKVLLNIYDLETKKKDKRTIKQLDKVLSYEVSANSKDIVLSGVRNGQTDIYIYHFIGNNQIKLTDDLYDDLYPSFIDDDNGIIFSSNRDNDTLNMPAKNSHHPVKLDVFIYHLDKQSNILTRLTTTTEVNEINPVQYDDGHYSFLSDENGIVNRYSSYLDSTISHIDTIVHYRYVTKTIPLTNYSRNILEVNKAGGTDYGMLMYLNGKYHFYNGDLSKDNEISEDVGSTNYMEDVGNNLNNIFVDTMEEISFKVYPNHEESEKEVDVNNYSFEDNNPVFEKETITIITENDQDTSKVNHGFMLPDQRMYKLNFASDYVVSQVDNNFLNATYQRYSGYGSVFYNPGFNGLIKIGISDLFENYKVVGGFRLAGDLNSNEYMLTFENLSRRWDKLWMFHRQAFIGIQEPWVVKVFTHEVKYVLKYPFSEVASIRGTLSYRNDKQSTLSIDYNSLLEPDVFENSAGVKLEYVFDNVINKGINLYNGLRFKLFGEYYQNINTQDYTNLNGVFTNGNFFVLGLDFRYYLKIHRDIIWANRLSASTSFGNRKLLYYMGGVDNWLMPRYDYNVEVDQTQNYYYQTIASPMRGFLQNARNGNSFALINSEIRIPVFKYLIQRPLKSDFLENFQVMTFGDIGTAWTGPDPYSQDNSFNTQTISQYPLNITLYSQREPIIGGFGWGLRSRLFGYFIRFDVAWGVDDFIIQKPIKYLSLSLDF